jgi:hypothetical protein
MADHRYDEDAAIVVEDIDRTIITDTPAVVT